MDFKCWVYTNIKARPVTLTLHTTHASLRAAETALATPVFSPREPSRSLRLWTGWTFQTPSLPPVSPLSGGKIHALHFQKHEMRGRKSKPSFLSLNHCLVPASALLAYCPLRTHNGFEALNGKKHHQKKKVRLGFFQPFSDPEVCCMNSYFVLFLLQLK